MPGSTDDEVKLFSGGRFEQCTGLPGREETPYIDPVSSELPPGGIQPDDTPKRPARVTAKPSRFRDDQFETEFRPGPRKYRVQRVGLDLGKGEPTAVQEEQPQTEPKAPARQWCQALGKGEPNRFRPHYRPKATVRKKQQQLLRPTKVVLKSKGSLLRNNHGKEAINNELLAALQPPGAQNLKYR